MNIASREPAKSLAHRPVLPPTGKLPLLGHTLKPHATYFWRGHDSAFVVGQAILPAAAFPGGSSGGLRVLASRKSRLQPGLAAPRIMPNTAFAKGKWHYAEACPTSLYHRNTGSFSRID